MKYFLNFGPNYNRKLCVFLDIWRNFELTNAHCFCNINVLSIGHIHVFIGILWTRDVVAQLENETDHLIIVLIIIAPNSTRLQDFVLKEMSKFKKFLENIKIQDGCFLCLRFLNEASVIELRHTKPTGWKWPINS